MWVEAFNDFMEHLSLVGELKREVWMWEEITALESLMRGRHIGGNPSRNLIRRVI